MGIVRTILGDVDSSQLGGVNAHEHLIRTGGLEILKNGEDWRLNDVKKAIAETKLFAQAGGKTIVDMVPASNGRDVNIMLEIAKAVPEVHLIMCTGFSEGRIYDNVTHWSATYDVNTIADLLIADVEEGIDEYDYNGPVVKRSTGKAGCIKIGTAYGLITPVEEKLIKAAAIAAIKTGACINTHTAGGTMALEQAQRLIAYGVKPERIALGHVQRNPDVWYQQEDPQPGCEYDVRRVLPYQIFAGFFARDADPRNGQCRFPKTNCAWHGCWPPDISQILGFRNRRGLRFHSVHASIA